MNQFEISHVSDAHPIDTYLEKRIRLFNIYTLPQVAWIIELYYLMLNSLLVNASALGIKEVSIYSFPPQVNEYNLLIHQYLMQWAVFIQFLALGLLVSGFIISLVRAIPVLSDYKVISIYSKYGITSCMWFFLLGFTYNLYSYSPRLFPVSIFLVIFFIVSLKSVVKIIIEKIEKVLGIEFDL